MNDEQIKDSFTNLAASAPTTDLWPHVRNQIGSQKPNRYFWPSFRLRPLLVSLNVLVVALLLFMVISPILTAPLTTRRNSNPVASQPTNQPASPATQQAATASVSTSKSCQDAGTIAQPLSGIPFYTLPQWVQGKSGDPDFMLPTSLPGGYALSGFTAISAQGPFDANCHSATDLHGVGWNVEYDKAGDMQPYKLTIRGAGRDQNTASADFRASFTYACNLWASPGPVTASYQHPNRYIELHHNGAHAPYSQGVFVFITDSSNETIAGFYIQAYTSVTNDQLVSIADSIAPVDTQHLERYR